MAGGPSWPFSYLPADKRGPRKAKATQGQTEPEGAVELKDQEPSGGPGSLLTHPPGAECHYAHVRSPSLTSWWGDWRGCGGP